MLVVVVLLLLLYSFQLLTLPYLHRCKISLITNVHRLLQIVKFSVRGKIYINIQYINGSFISHDLCVYFTLYCCCCRCIDTKMTIHLNENTLVMEIQVEYIISSYWTLFVVEMDGNTMHKSQCKFLYGMFECR